MSGSETVWHTFHQAARMRMVVLLELIIDISIDWIKCSRLNFRTHHRSAKAVELSFRIKYDGRTYLLQEVKISFLVCLQWQSLLISYEKSSIVNLGRLESETIIFYVIVLLYAAGFWKVRNSLPAFLDWAEVFFLGNYWKVDYWVFLIFSSYRL